MLSSRICFGCADSLAAVGAVYVMRIDTRGIREYYFYFGGSAALTHVLPSLRSAHPDYRIEFEETADPGWNRYKTFLSDHEPVESHYAKLIRVALLYGAVCFLLQWGVSVLGWRLFPDLPKDSDLTSYWHWTIHMTTDKLVGVPLFCVAALLASRAHHPTWKWGVATGIAAAVADQLIAVLVYIVRFGGAAYQQYNDFFYTMLWAVLLGLLFGFLAVWRQYFRERHAA